MHTQTKQRAGVNPYAYTKEIRTVSAKVDTETLRNIRELAVASDMTVSRLLGKAIEQYLSKHY